MMKTPGITSWKVTSVVKKNEIPFTAIGRDHCVEQENKVLKGRGGVSGQSSNSNSTNRYFMTAPILSQIYSDMQKQGGGSDVSRKFHHQLGKAYIHSVKINGSCLCCELLKNIRSLCQQLKRNLFGIW